MEQCNIYGVIDPREREEFRYVGKTPYSIAQRLDEHIRESKRKGKTWEELYGTKKAKEMKQEQSEARLGKTFLNGYKKKKAT